MVFQQFSVLAIVFEVQIKFLAYTNNHQWLFIHLAFWWSVGRHRRGCISVVGLTILRNFYFFSSGQFILLNFSNLTWQSNFLPTHGATAHIIDIWNVRIREIHCHVFVHCLAQDASSLVYIFGGSYQIIDLTELCFSYIFLPSSEAC